MKKETHKGFISLFTVLLATVILAIGIGMSSMALKQIVLASTADDANEAFYSADAGLQCAVMHDIQGVFTTGGLDTINCGSAENITINTSDSGTFIFNEFEWNNQNCVRIRVEKSDTETRIEALGYNVSCEEIGQSPRAVERALRVRYGG